MANEMEPSANDPNDRAHVGKIEPVMPSNLHGASGIPGTSRRQALKSVAWLGLGLGLAACGSSDESDDDLADPGGADESNDVEPSPSASPVETTGRGPVEIRYWYWADNPAIGAFFAGTIERFNESQNSIQVVGEQQPATAAAREAMVAAHAAGSGAPDATYGNTPQMVEYFDAGITVPLEDMFNEWDDKDDVLPFIIETHRVRDGDPLSYMPFGIAAEMQYYRSDQYEELGLEPPDTVQALLENARALNDPPNRYGFGLRGADQFGFTWQFLTHLMNLGIKIVDFDGNTDLDSDEGIANATMLLEPFWDGVAQPTALEDRFPQMTAQMQTGRVSHWGASTNHSAFLLGQLGQFDDVIDAVLQPRGEGMDRQVTMATVGHMITEQSSEPEAAFEFIKWMMQPDEQAEFGQAAAFTPTRASVLDREFFLENRFHQLTRESEPDFALYPYWHKNWPEFHVTTGVELWQQALLRQISVEDLMSSLADIMRDV